MVHHPAVKPYRCTNRSCRTLLGEMARPSLLVVPADAAPEHDGEVWWIVCPVCQRRVWWGGAVAQRIEAQAA